MKRIYTPVTKIRRDVFTNVSKWCFDNQDKIDLEYLDGLPYKIIKGEIAKYRDSVFVERAIVAQRIKLALNLPLDEPTKETSISKSYRENINNKNNLPILDVIPFACDACKPNTVTVTNNCRGCLAHPCSVVCPVSAISIVDKKSYIKDDLCIRCGKCVKACPYTAIVKYDRPCSRACGVNAITFDSLKRAVIDHNKCVACGQCIVNCPFGAISDKSQILDIITGLYKNEKINCIIAPAFIGQFGIDVTFSVLSAALISIGFNDCFEVAHGADEVAKIEAKHFIDSVGDDIKFLGTSCCPAWKLMVERNFSDISYAVSGKQTPMIVTAKDVKKQNPNCKVLFIGPCTAKKLEAKRDYVLDYVDYVLTFEELMGIFIAKKINFSKFFDTTFYKTPPTPLGLGFPLVNGVANAIINSTNLVENKYNIIIDKVDSADGLFACKKMMQLAKAGKRDGYLLEGLACPGGCVMGNGVIVTK